MITDIRFASALQEAVYAGQFFPGWANDNFGFGSIGVRFYPPVALYLLAFTEILVGDWFWALWIDLLFWMFIGCAGVYMFVKEWGTSVHGLIGAITYAVVPQHLNEIFQFFLFAEFAAWGVLPFCFLFVTRVCRNARWADAVWFAMAYSVLILTHIPTTMIATLAFPVYVLAVTDWRKWKTVLSRLIVAIMLTLAATAFRWYVIVTEFDWLAHNDPKWATGYFQFSTWLFPNILHDRELFIYVLSSWLFDISIMLTIALIIPSIVWLLLKRKAAFGASDRVQFGAIVTGLFALFMLSRPSQFVWEGLSFLQRIQFPWRWLSVLGLMATVAFALSVPRLFERFNNRSRFVAYPALALLVTIILFNITQIIIPSAPIPYAEFDEVEKEVAEEPMFEGWWPTSARPIALENPKLADAATRDVDIIKWEAIDRAFTVQEGNAGNLRVATFYYPHWKATINDAPVRVEHDEGGAILLPLAGDYSKVHLTFEEPFGVKAMRLLSLATWLGICVVLLLLILNRKYISGPDEPPIP
jgi:hypothetical protein